jgi:hypothetical protein
VAVNVVDRVLGARLSDEPMDAWLSRWGCTLGSLALPGFALAALGTHPASRQEFVLGATAAGVVGLLLFLLGSLARHVHLAAAAGRAPWRARRGELFSHAVGLATAGFGGWAVITAAPGAAGAVIGGLLVLAAYTAVLCLGCWSTVVLSLRAAVSAESSAAPDRRGE